VDFQIRASHVQRWQRTKIIIAVKEINIGAAPTDMPLLKELGHSLPSAIARPGHHIIKSSYHRLLA